MKTLKFAHNLVGKIIDGSKTVTWRLFDDKDLLVGDRLQFINGDTRDGFAEAEIVAVQEKKLGEIEEADCVGHEKYADQEEMLETYRGYYGDSVDRDTAVKIIEFKLLN
ncbi:MAG: ASCH domain-containing protein [Candidatus Paceibacterota bacterium]